MVGKYALKVPDDDGLTTDIGGFADEVVVAAESFHGVRY